MLCETQPCDSCRRARGGDTYLSVIDLAGAEESGQRVVAGDNKARDVNEELAGDVEEDEEEVEGSKAQDRVDLGHRSLLLKVVEGGVLRQLEGAL